MPRASGEQDPPRSSPGRRALVAALLVGGALLIAIVVRVSIGSSSGGGAGGGAGAGGVSAGVSSVSSGSSGRVTAGAVTTVASTTQTSQAAAGVNGEPSLALSLAPYQLTTAVEGAAAAAGAGGQMLMAGGLDSAGLPRRGVVDMDAQTLIATERMTAPLTDAAAASIGGVYYLFGGDLFKSDRPTPTPSGAILQLSPSGATLVVGQLPSPIVDAAATVIDGTAYLVGGESGGQPLDSVIAWSPGLTARVVATLPQALRFAAVAAVDGQVIIAGGTTATGVSRAIYGFDPQSGTVIELTGLPMPVTHAAAVAADGRMFVIGGRASVQGTQTDHIEVYDPGDGQVAAAGLLPSPLSDAAAVTLSTGQVLLAGGIDDAGQLHTEVYLGSVSG